MKLNNFVFAGAPLVITENAEGWPQYQHKSAKSKLSQESLERKNQLQEVLGNRYNPEAKLLDLSSLGEDPVLINMGYLENKDRAEKTFKILMHICDETFPTVEAKRDAVLSVSLANNSIENVGQVFTLAETFPHLQHLDLRGNKLQDLRSLNKWHGRFRGLETLLLVDNPIEATGNLDYRSELLGWFPRLQNLSNEQVRTAEEVAAAAAAGPPPISQHGADFRDSRGFAEAFLMQFLPQYDSDRAQLVANFYDAESLFSLSVTTHSPHDPNWPTAPWASYMRFSRNLTKITNIGARTLRLIKGSELIKELWGTLPVTKHPDLKTDIHKYIVDCHPLPGLLDPTSQSPVGVDGLVISMHGEFDEMDQPSGKLSKRSFSRTFVLGPAAPGKPSPIRVVSDMLSLRAYNALPSSQGVVSAPPQDAKQLMVAELSKRTNMTPHFSELCLEEAGWNLDNAMIKFNEIRVSHPRPPIPFILGTSTLT